MITKVEVAWSPSVAQPPCTSFFATGVAGLAAALALTFVLAFARMFALFSVGQSLKGDACMALRAPTVPYLSSFNYLPPVLAQRPHLERGAGSVCRVIASSLHKSVTFVSFCPMAAIARCTFAAVTLEEHTACASERTDRGSGLKLLLPATRVITKNILAPLAIALRLNPGFCPSATQTRPITGP